MKQTLSNLIVVFLAIFIVYLLWNNGEEPIEEKKVEYITKTITIKGTSDTVYIPKPKPYKVTQYVIDSSLIDSIGKLNTLLELAKVREYKNTYSDSIISLNIYSKVIGRLDSINVIYDLKPQKIQYTETHTETILKPKYSLYYGFGASSNATINVNVGFENSKGNYFGVGYDTQQNILVSYRKRFYTKY